MEKLISGLHAFQQTCFDSHRHLFERLAKGQSPETLFITCSDSRINPNLLTQTGPGDLFIIRNAGNIVPAHGAGVSGEGATIEYAVAALGVRHIVVCGHSHCGAMKGILEPEGLADLPQVRKWLGHAEATRRIIQENYKDRDPAAMMTATIEENVLVQLENLRTHPTVAAKLGRGELFLHGWVYKIETGEVFSYDPEQGQFFKLVADAEAQASMEFVATEPSVIA